MKISLVLEGQPSELIDALHKVTNEHLVIPVGKPVPDFDPRKVFGVDFGGVANYKSSDPLDGGHVRPLQGTDDGQDAGQDAGNSEKEEKPKKSRKSESKPKSEPEVSKPETEEKAAAPDEAGQETPEVEDSKPEAKTGKKLELEAVRKVFGTKWQADSKAVLALLKQTGHKSLTEFWGDITDNDERANFLEALSAI